MSKKKSTWFTKNIIIIGGILVLVLALLIIGLVNKEGGILKNGGELVSADKEERASKSIDLDGFSVPVIEGYEEAAVTTGTEGTYIGLTFMAIGELKKQITSAIAIISAYDGPSEYDYSNFNANFPLDNQEIVIGEVSGRMGYEDLREQSGGIISVKYETIQIEIVKDGRLFRLQLGRPDGQAPNKDLYKDEAVKIMEALLAVSL